MTSTMQSRLEELERNLFFTDVPDGTLKQRDAVRDSTADIGQTFSNLGADLKNTLLCNDLDSIAPSQTKMGQQKQKERKEKEARIAAMGDPVKAFRTLYHYEEEDGFNPMACDEDMATPFEKHCRRMTIPPPSIARMERRRRKAEKEHREEEIAEMAMKQAELLEELS